jgi:hypothetical protein
MPPKKISTLIKEAAAIKDRQKKIDFLRWNSDNPGLRAVFTGVFDPTVKWLLPKGKVPYGRNRLVDQGGQLYNELRKLYLFIEGGNNNLQQHRREELFIQLLERIDPEDAELMECVKDKKLPVKGITADIVREAFPGLLPDG